METRTMKWIGLALVAAVLFTIAPAAQAAVPAGEYRIMFVTDEYDVPAMPSSFTTLDDFVQTVAAAGSVTSTISTTWQAMVATSTVKAMTHTATDPAANLATSVPIYRLNNTGAELVYEQISDGYVNLWDGGLDAPSSPEEGVWFNQNGAGTSKADGTQGLTGFNNYGVTGVGIDSAMPTFGYFDSNNGWAMTDDYTSPNHMYAISGVIPEPATMSLLAIGGVALLRRKRK